MMVFLTILGIVIQFLITYFGFLIKIKSDIAVLKTQIGPFWNMVEKNLPNLLHSPTHKRKDELLDKMQNGKLDKREMHELRDILVCALNNGEYLEDKRITLILVLSRLEQLIGGVKVC